MQENDFDMNQTFMNYIGSMLNCTVQYILDHSTYSKNASEQRKRFDKYSKTIREIYRRDRPKLCVNLPQGVE